MKFPKRIPFRKEIAIIYGKTKARPYYRVAWNVAGKRQMKSFLKYGEAKAHAEKTVRDLAKGSHVTALSDAQARDALAAFDTLHEYRQRTGQKLTLNAAVLELVSARGKLSNHTLNEAVEGFLDNIANVKRKDIKEAVGDFVGIRKPLTESKGGKRAQLSKGYAGLVALWLGWFADAFPNTCVCELTQEHLNLWMRKFSKQAPSSRNHYRGALKMFLRWCVKRDYIKVNHRLFEADGLTTEQSDTSEIDFYRPTELKAMLDRAGSTATFKDLLPVIAMGGLAGLRLQEILRLDWADVWHVAGHIEVTAGKAKTRQRRLVEICPALAQWLEPYRESSGAIFGKHRDTFHELFNSLLESCEITSRRNGLRHGFVTFHFAAHSNENLTAAQAGNSPGMIFAHYRGMATKAEAEKWFNVSPIKSAAATKQQQE